MVSISWKVRLTSDFSDDRRYSSRGAYFFDMFRAPFGRPGAFSSRAGCLLPWMGSEPATCAVRDCLIAFHSACVSGSASSPWTGQSPDFEICGLGETLPSQVEEGEQSGQRLTVAIRPASRRILADFSGTSRTQKLRFARIQAETRCSISFSAA